MNNRELRDVRFWDTGRIDYAEAWDGQKKLMAEVIGRKLHNRNHPDEAVPQHHFLLFCEHNHVYTLGKTGSAAHLLLSNEGLGEQKAQFFHIDRGGDITYHGPGQITGYPIFDLECFFTDVHRYVRTLEEAVIRTIAGYGLEGRRVEGASGVWLDATDDRPERKICAIGVHLSRWVTMHGFAFNVNTDLNYFNHIIPCGIQDKGVTSMQAELGGEQDLSRVKRALVSHLAECFGFRYRDEAGLF